MRPLLLLALLTGCTSVDDPVTDDTDVPDTDDSDTDGGDTGDSEDTDVVEPPEVSLHIDAATVDEGASVDLRVVLSGAYEVDVAVGLVGGGEATPGGDYVLPPAVTVPAGETEVVVPLETVDEGIYEGDEVLSVALGEVLEGTATVDPAPATVLLVEATPSGTWDVSPWGIATSHSSSWNVWWLEPIGETGIHHVRGYDRANAVERLPQIAGWGFDVSGILQTGGTFDLEPAVWEAHVDATLARAGGQVRDWEVWNEPPNFSASKDPALYAPLVVSAYDRIKEADETMNVGLTAQSVNLTFMASALESGAAGHYDYITLHPYETLGRAQVGHEALFMAIVPTVRAMLRDLDPENEHVPIVYTELGALVGDGRYGVPADEQADIFVKSYVMALASGVTRIHWFEGVDGDSGDFGLIARDRTLRPSYHAATNLIAALGDRPRYLGWVLLEEAHYGFIFEGASEPVLVAWARPETRVDVDLGAAVTVQDPASGDVSTGPTVALTPSPLLVTGLPGALVDEARANRVKPFPWDGDYTDAASISVSAADGEDGLHMLGEPTVITVDGDPAFDISTGPGVSFAIDPNFSTWDEHALRVTVEVRYTGDGSEGAGFNMKMESKAGYRGHGGWTNVPRDGAWHTLTFDVDEPMLHAKWGYHMSLDSDSTAFTHYALRKITVDKR